MGIIPAMALMLMTSGVAQEPQAGQAQAKAAEQKEVTAIVVSTDAALKTIAVKKEAMPGDVGTATEMTLPVDDKAITSLKTVKAGDRVKLSLKVDSTSKRESVSAIEKAPPRP
jgi:Cu/Ag efflux protein CusF